MDYNRILLAINFQRWEFPLLINAHFDREKLLVHQNSTGTGVWKTRIANSRE